MRMLKIALIAVLIVLIAASPVAAITLTDLPPGQDLYDENIKILKYANGDFRGISYMIKSTGATSGIRYRTSAVTVDINGVIATVDISHLVGKATAGKTNASIIAITTEDIIASVGEQYRSQVENMNPEEIQIGAHIQIYNKGTGQVLENITSQDQVYDKASKWGFGSQDITDMKTRFLQDYTSGPVIIEEEHEYGYGVRPSILVK